jgi:hypothetical protein
MIRLALTTALLAAAAGIGVAVAQTNDPTINACVHDGNGDARIVSGTTCRRHEHLVTWAQAGPTGPTGPQGPSGPAGVSEAWAVDRSPPVGIPMARDAIRGPEVTVTSLDLAAGHYVAQGSLDLLVADEAYESSMARGQCVIYAGSRFVATSLYDLGNESGGFSPHRTEHISLLGPVFLDQPTTVAIRCFAYGGVGTIPEAQVQALGWMTAKEVGTVHFRGSQR